jgi:hypothetical protein
MEGTEADANAAPAAPASPEAAGVPTSSIEDGFDRIPVDAISDIDAPGEGEKPAARAAKPDGGKPAEKAGAPGKAAGEGGTEDGGEGEAAKDDGTDDASEKEADGKDGEGRGGGKPDRFDRHPRFQELIGKVRDLTAQLAEARGAMEGRAGQQAGGQAPKPEKLPFVDITTKSKAELLEWQEEDPVGYAANLYKQMQYEIEKSIVSKAQAARTQAEWAAQRAAVKTTYEAYEKRNPDFRQMWDSGQIVDFMSKNPGHNAISAHRMLTEQARIDAAVKAAREAAVKETEEKVRADFLAKRNATVIPDGGTLKSTGEVPDELKNPDKYGGRVSAGAERLRRLRAGGTA